MKRFSSQEVLGQTSGLSTLAEASVLLDVSVQALEDTRQEGLQPADMVSLIQLLSVAADSPTELFATNQSQVDIQGMSQNFISMANSIISEDNPLKWQAIKEVQGALCENSLLVTGITTLRRGWCLFPET